MFGDLSFSHILILLLVLVLVFGAKRIPEIGSSLGQGIKEFKRSLKDATSDDPPTTPPRGVQPPTSNPLSSGDPKRLAISSRRRPPAGRSRCGGPRSWRPRAARR